MSEGLGPLVGTTLRIIGKCRGCDKDHDGPLFVGLKQYGGITYIAVGTADEESFHVMEVIPLAGLVDIDTLVEFLS